MSKICLNPATIGVVRSAAMPHAVKHRISATKRTHWPLPTRPGFVAARGRQSFCGLESHLNVNAACSAWQRSTVTSARWVGAGLVPPMTPGRLSEETLGVGDAQDQQQDPGDQERDDAQGNGGAARSKRNSDCRGDQARPAVSATVRVEPARRRPTTVRRQRCRTR